MASINQVTLLGNVGKDPVVRYLENQSKVAMFSLATTEYYKDRDGQRKENTEWHNIVAFGVFASTIESYVHKGSQVAIIGKLRTREYEQNGQRKWTTEVIVQNLQLCGSRQDIQAAGLVRSAQQFVEGQQARPVTPQQAQTQAAPATFEAPSDDLPF